jgi:hypothetical protein
MIRGIMAVTDAIRPKAAPQRGCSMRSGEIVSMLAISSVLYLLLVALIVYVGRTVEFKLIALGLLTGVLAVWFSQTPGIEGVSIQARPGQPGAEMALSVGGAATAAGVLGRIAVLLTVGGLALIFWGRWTPPAPTARPEEGIRADRI